MSSTSTARLLRGLGVAGAVLLVIAACTNRWLDHDDMHFGLLGLRLDGERWIWHQRWIEVASEMNEPLARTTAFMVSGIAAMVASCVAAIAIVATSLRAERWIRWIAIAALLVAIAAVVAFLATKPELEDEAVSRYTIGAPSRYLPSWSLIAFGAGVLASAVATRRRT